MKKSLPQPVTVPSMQVEMHQPRVDDLAGANPEGLAIEPDREPADAFPEQAFPGDNYGELLASEIRYRRLFEAARDGILILDPDTCKITDANPYMTELLGYSREELIGKELWQIGLLKDEKASLDAFKQLKKNRYVRYENLPLVDKSGDSHQVEFVSNLYLESGREVIQSNIRDITQRRRAEEKIKEQATFLDEARDAIVVGDLEGKILFWNKGAERLYQWTSHEALGQNVGRLLCTDPGKFQELNALVQAQGEWAGEIEHKTKNRGEIVIEAHWTLMRDGENVPKSVLAINTDVTEKKRIEAQFMRAQRMESIGTLAGGIAHDLNNILTPIMMSIDVLKETHGSPSCRILETMEASAKRGADIVRQVLSFARGMDVERIEIQPKHLLQDLENFIQNTFPKNIELEFLETPDTWTILGDPTQLHQVLLNLCVNARDAMPTGGKLSLSIENRQVDERYAEDAQYATTSVQAKAGPYVKIAVTDTGIGIKPELLNKIFEPFFTTRELHKGTGLGLSTVMAIVKSHEGIINVYSEPGVGTSFSIYIPAVATGAGNERNLPDIQTMPRGRGETILVVDDESLIVTVTSETLQAFGYRVLTAVNGADAVAIYAEHKKDIAVVLTDMMMPVMDGSATIHALTRINPAVKIVAMSGLTANSLVARMAGEGLRHFLTKPYTAGTLLKTVRSVIDDLSLI